MTLQVERRTNAPLAGEPAAPVDQRFDRAVQTCLAAVMLVAPWFMGGRHPLGQLLLVVLAVGGMLSWGMGAWSRKGSMNWALSPAHAFVFAGIALVGLQLLPLPEPLLHCVSPQLRQLLPLWFADAGEPARLGRWSQVSLVPSESRAALVMLLTYGLLFCVALQHLRSVDSVERMLRWLGLSAVLLALVGLLQYQFGNGRFLWIYEHPFRTTAGAALGPFTNPNHFAHLLALGFGPLVWLLQRAIQAHREARRAAGQWPACETTATGWTLCWRLVAVGIVLLAGLMTFSRGGVAMMFLAAAVSAGLMYHAGLLGRRVLRGLATIFLLIGVVLAIRGYQRDSERLGDYAGHSLERLLRQNARSKIWRADLHALGDFWVLGAGAGSHREVCPRYLTEPRPHEFRHVDNGYLQVALEIGLPGLALLVGGVAWCLTQCVVALRRPRSPRVYDCATAVTAGLVVSVVHSLMDFVWFVPACMGVTTLLAACAVRLAQFTIRPEAHAQGWHLRLTRGRLALAAVALVPLGGWMVDQRGRAALAAPHWEANLHAALKSRDALPIVADDAAVDHLEQIVYWTPDDARAHLRLAATRLARCEWLSQPSPSALALSQVRDAASTSESASPQELSAWFEKAVGKRGRDLGAAQWHARRALELCPLEGEGYVYLADLCFLAGGGREVRSAYIRQALRVRPYDPPVLLAAGNEAALAGDLDTAMDDWRQVFNAGPDERNHLIGLLVADRVPVELVIERFQPDLEATRLLEVRYREVLSAEAMEPLLRHYLRVGETAAASHGEEEAAPLWAELNGVYKRLGQSEKALRCLRRAAAGRPNDYQLRSTLGLRLFDEQEYSEAEMHLKWCLQRRPEDDRLQTVLALAVCRKLEAEPHAPASLPATRR